MTQPDAVTEKVVGDSRNGVTFDDVAVEAMRMAGRSGRPVQLTFDVTTLTVTPDLTFQELKRAWYADRRVRAMLSGSGALAKLDAHIAQFENEHDYDAAPAGR